MKRFSGSMLVSLISGYFSIVYSQTGSIRINQVGYYPEAAKIGFVVFARQDSFQVVDNKDNTIVLTGNLSTEVFWKDAGDSIKYFDFSALTSPGSYKIRIPGSGESSSFEISDTVLRKAAYASLKSYYYQRCSYELTAPYAGLWARPAGHADTACILHSSTGKSGRISSPGGWYDAGDYGKYVINAGISVASLLSFHENFDQSFKDGSIHIPESGNGKSELLDEVMVELDWLKTMQDSDGGVFFKLTTLNFPGFIMPDKDIAPRYAIGKSTSSALDFAAMMAMAGRIYPDYDSTYAADCIMRAENAWIWAKANPTVYFTNPADVSTGQYGDNNVTDEFLWAAAELYITTQKDEYKSYLESRSSSLLYQREPGWPSVQPLASLSLVTRPNGLSETLLNTIKSSVISTANSWLNQIFNNAGRTPTFSYNWGSNGTIANQGVGLLYAYVLTGDSKYILGASECADYLLGRNATGYSFVSGYGAKTPMNFHHRPSYADGVVQPVPGFLAGGPNAGRQDNEKYPFIEPAKCFVDVMGSYASNEVCINWNSPMTVLFAGIDAVLGDSSAVDFEVQTSMNNPPALTITTPGYDGKISSDKQALVKCTASDPDGVLRIELYLNSKFVSMVSSDPFEWNLDPLSVGDYKVTLLAFDSKGLCTEKTHPFRYYPVFYLPAKIQAEEYSTMSGIKTQVTSDTDAGLNVTGIDPTDWLDYSVNVQDPGAYQVEFRVASAAGGGKLELRKSSTVLSSLIINDTGGLQKWISLRDTVNLNAGQQTLRLYAVKGGWNINWIDFVLLNPTDINPDISEENVNSVSVVPNPVSDGFMVNYTLINPEPVDFVLFDNNGRMITKINDLECDAHTGNFSWPVNGNFLPGVYYLSMQLKGRELASVRFIKTR
jgi:endoglucanase